MGITHKWTGSILTITSDSGTTSMDLLGPKGDKGCRGPQGRAGCIVNADGTIDMTGYATETYVDEKLSDVQDVDLSNYYTKEQTLTLIDNVEVDLSDYYTKSETDAAVKNVEVDLTDYYTKSETDVLLENVEVDLTDYATKTYVDNAVEDVDLTGYATENFVSAKIAAAQLAGAETPVDLSAYATTDYVDNALENFDGGVGKAGTGTNAEIFNNYSKNQAIGYYSHAEGSNTTASGDYSHAEGNGTKASGGYSHAEGWDTTSSNLGSHAEGIRTTASNQGAHAEGTDTVAKAIYSHAEGYGTVAKSAYQHVQGAYNVQDPEGGSVTQGKYLHIVGNGKKENGVVTYSNAHTLDWDGNAWFAGKVYVGGTSMDDAVELGTGGSADLSGYLPKDGSVPMTGRLIIQSGDGLWLDDSGSTANLYMNFDRSNNCAALYSDGDIAFTTFNTRIIGVANPINDADVATKAYVDTAITNAVAALNGDEVEY